MGTLLQDVRYALRRLKATPAASFILLAIIAIGIGGATAMFSVLDAVVLRPLPFPRPDQLVVVSGASAPPSGDRLEYWRQAKSFEALALYASGGVNLAAGSRLQRVQVAVASSSFFQVFGVNPMLGRPFLPTEEAPGADRVAVLSHALWQQVFGADPAILGRSVSLNSITYRVIGIMPEGFRFPGRTDLWVPMVKAGGQALDIGSDVRAGLPSSIGAAMVGRLRAGVTLAQAKSELITLLHRLTATYTARTGVHFGEFISVVPLQEAMVRGVRPGLVALFGAVCFVLLIVCASAGNIMLAQAAARRREVAVRAAFGASPVRIVRQLLTESLVLGALGGSGGVLLAIFGARAVRALGPESLPRLAEVGFDGRVLGFAVFIALLTGVVVGLAPAIQARKLDPFQALKEAGWGSGRVLWRTARRGLVIAQIALAVVLLNGALLMLVSLARLTRVQSGIEPKNAITMEMALPKARYGPPRVAASPGVIRRRAGGWSPRVGGRHAAPSSGSANVKAERQEAGDYRVISFHQRLTDKIKALPGVEAVGAVDQLPLSGLSGGYEFFDIGPKLSLGKARVFTVSGQYFRAMGIPILIGRGISDRDSRAAPKVAVIDQNMASRFWGSGDPVGAQFVIEGEDRPREIVGVVGDVKFGGLGDPPEPEIYVPYTQPYRGGMAPLDMTFVVRAARGPKQLIPQLRREALSVDSELPVFHVRTMEQVINESVAPERFRSANLGLFAALAILLATLGVYGLMSYSVTCRTHEVGVRMSLGATPRDIVLMILGEGARLTFAGVGLGVLGALGTSRFLQGLLFGIRPNSPTVLICSCLLFFITALVACGLPASRAGVVDPAQVLRFE